MHYSVENIQAQSSNLWEELTSTQCQAVSGGVLLKGVTSAYYSVTPYGKVANFPEGYAYTPSTVPKKW